MPPLLLACLWYAAYIKWHRRVDHVVLKEPSWCQTRVSHDLCPILLRLKNVYMKSMSNLSVTQKLQRLLSDCKERWPEIKLCSA